MLNNEQAIRCPDDKYLDAERKGRHAS